MDFALKVLLSFIVGGLAVSAVVWTSERLGSHIGGAIAGIPTTISLSLIFICFTEGSSTARASSVIIPVIILVGLLYTFVFTQAARYMNIRNKQLGATLIATMAWLVAAVIVRFVFANANLLVTVLVFLVGVVIAKYLFRNLRSAKPKKLNLPNSTYAVRFLVAGGVVASAVLATRLLGSLWGGVVSTAPAIASISLYLLYKSQGSAFTEGFVKRLPLSYVSAVVFVVILHTTLTHVPTYLAFLLGIIGSLTYTYILLIVNKPTKVVEQID
ncbi:MAG TPA: DUF3147 family protein [Candidatus Saccharimonadales bacterium]|nr:DUF3147 family protein [Candidatus Saccharimonadales bacterium]